jgi:type 1 glutamine amidotransferase
MRVLVLYGDFFHPGQAARGGLEQLAKTYPGFEFDWVDDMSNWSKETLADYPVVVLTKSNDTSATNRTPWVTPEIEEAFEQYVRQGHGLLAIHSGTASYKANHTLRGLLGGVFTHHPAQCHVTVEPQPGELLSGDSGPFTVFDEHYFMDTAPGNAIFLLTRSEHGVQPGGWTRSTGEGRVCVLTPGHNPAVWLDPTYQVLLHNALRWVAKQF